MSGYANTLAGRIRQFFDNCQDEYLTMHDICVKFDCTKKQAQDAVQHLARAGDVKIARSVVMRKVSA